MRPVRWPSWSSPFGWARHSITRRSGTQAWPRTSNYSTDLRRSKLGLRDGLCHVRHGVEPGDHDVALGLVDAHGHIEAPPVELLVEYFGIAVQPADAGAV